MTNQTAEGTAFGNVEITATIENPSGDSQAGTLIGEVSIEGGDTYTDSTRVTVPSNSTITESVTVDIPLSQSLSEFRYSYEAQID